MHLRKHQQPCCYLIRVCYHSLFLRTAKGTFPGWQGMWLSVFMKQGAQCFEISLVKEEVFYQIQLLATVFKLIAFVVFLQLDLAVNILEVVLPKVRIKDSLTFSLPFMSNAN